MSSPISKPIAKGKRQPPILLAAMLAILATAPGPPAHAQTRPNGNETSPNINYEGERVTGVDLASRPGADVEYLRSIVTQQAEQPYSNAKVEQSIAALKSTGEFSSVRVQVVPDNGGLRLTFVLEPAYYLGLVEFPGATPTFTYSRLLQAVTFSDGSPFLKRQMDNATGALQTFFARNGFFAATVTPRTEVDNRRKLVHPSFDVTLHRRAKVGSIDFEGLSEAQAEQQRAALRSFWARFKNARLKNGTTFTAARIQGAIDFIRNNLAADNRLAEEISLKSVDYNPNSNRANLLFHVKLGPVVTVQVRGAHVFKRTLKRLVPIYQENAYDSDLVAEGRRNLTSYFQSKGYFDVQVTPEVQEAPDKVAVFYAIRRGSKHKVESVSFESNREIDDAGLKAAVVVRRKRFLFSRGRYSETLLRSSADKIVAMYHVMGFPDVRVTTAVRDFDPQVDITFQITEGTRTVVRNFGLSGDNGLDASQLPAHGFRLAAGKPYSPQLELEDRNDILAYYLDRGFLGAQLKAKVTSLAADKYQVDVLYQLQPGPQTLVQDVIYLGNVKTRESLISQTVGLHPEMPLSESKMLTAESDLYNLGIFDWTNVGPRRAEGATTQLEDPSEPVDATHETRTPEPRKSEPQAEGDAGASDQNQLAESEAAEADPPPGQSISLSQNQAVGASQNQAEDVLVKVHESQRNTIEYGAGFEIVRRGGTAPGGTVVVPGLPAIVLGRNFTTSESTFVGPRGSFSYTLRNMRGRGETFTASILGSRLDNRATLSYGVPRLWGTSWSSLLNATGERNTQNPIFTSTFGEGSLQIQRAIDERRTETLILRYRLRRTALSNLLIPDLVLPEDQDIRLSTLSVSLLRDTRDKPLDAHRGIYQTLDFGITPTALGASANFAKFLGQSAYYRPITSHLTWANNVRFGLAKPFFSSRVPISEAFFSGGSDTLRGFPINGAGPQRPVAACGVATDPSTCTTITVPVGGYILFVVNSELRFPIPLKEGLGAVVFYDGGNVYSRINLSELARNYTSSVGMGLRYQTPVGPVRFDIGHLVNRINGIGSVQFFVTLGQAF
jgi:outer membrane protein assembly factor BamA